MDALLDLAAILNKKRLSKIDILDRTFLNSNSNNLYYKLYMGLLSREFMTDQIACKKLYGVDKPNDKYRMLKSRLKKKMHATLLLIQPEEYFQNNIKNKVFYECITALNIVEILVKINGINQTAVELIKENYTKAYKFKFYEILKSFSYYLLYYYSLQGDSKKYFNELLKFNAYKESSYKELTVKQLTSHINLLFCKQHSINKEVLNEVKKNIEAIEKILKDFFDPESIYFYYYSISIYKEYTAAYSEILEINYRTEKLFKDFPFIASHARIILNKLSRIKVLLHLKHYTDGIELTKSLKNILPENSSYNWFVAKELEFKLYLNSYDITNANRIHKEVITNKFFKRGYSHSIERWKIYEAYLVFMNSYVNKGDYKYSVAKFINETSFYTKDKSGFNFSIRVIELLFLFAKKQYNIVFAKMDALKTYRTRYLNDDTYQRSRLFLNALLKAEKDGFNAQKMKKGYPEINQLNSKEQQLIIADWEVLPYEMIWDILVDLAKE